MNPGFGHTEHITIVINVKYNINVNYKNLCTLFYTCELSHNRHLFTYLFNSDYTKARPSTNRSAAMAYLESS